MREIHCNAIAEAVEGLCMDANYNLGEDVLASVRQALDTEESPVGREVLREILENAEIARDDEVPLCQDCGYAVVFVELGQEVHVTGGDFNEAIAEGVRQGYTKGYLRKSVAAHPYTSRVNTKDNTPAVVHLSVVPGDKIKITVAPKGGGSENMSALNMMKPADGKDGIVKFVVDTVRKAGANPCPPIIVGVGIGGTAERAMILAKKSLLRELGQPGADPEDADLERELFTRINKLGIGPMGLGGRTTALAVHVLSQPCHIASLPVAVNIQCHSARHKEAVL
jgi:fumarate hydratase subunit alpha